jgi:hypothetical protein
MQMVEKEFRNGVVPISEYVRITTTAAEVESLLNLSCLNS